MIGARGGLRIEKHTARVRIIDDKGSLQDLVAERERKSQALEM